MPNNYSEFWFAILEHGTYLIIALEEDVRSGYLTDRIPEEIHQTLAEFKIHEVVEGRFEGAALRNSAPVIRALNRLGLKTSKSIRSKIIAILEELE